MTCATTNNPGVDLPQLNGAGERKMTSRQTIALITLLMASLRKIRATAQVQNGPDVVGVYDNFNSKWLDPTKWTTGPKTAGAGVLCNVSGKVRAGSYACRCGTPAQRTRTVVPSLPDPISNSILQ